jgi:hypothetical protein
MGSIISFPFLCIANAAFCRYALELADDRKYAVARKAVTCRTPLARLRVNGDDCVLFSMNKELREIWEKTTRVGGLESSVGKTYFSDRFAVINSVHFRLDGTEWLQQGYVNMGLIYGLDKVGVSFEDPNKTEAEKRKERFKGKDISQLGAVHRKLKETCPKEVWDKANQMFFYKNKNTLSKYAGPWTLPTWCGGLGLVPSGEYSKRDLQIAGAMRLLISKGDKPRSFLKEKEWEMHEIVAKRMEELLGKDTECFARMETEDLLGEPLEISLEESNQNIYNRLIIECLFHQELDQIFLKKRRREEEKKRRREKGGPSSVRLERVKTVAQTNHQVLLHNLRIYRKAVRLVDSEVRVIPCEQDEIEQETIKTWYPAVALSEI